uniref:Uncharacterized protein n=1 Tax=Panagrolaimus sp. ES5 TaxID=591445 RepID=A0AC34GUY1_9BILA
MQSIFSYPVNECLNLLTSREANTRSGPLFTRRSASTTSSSSRATTSPIQSTGLLFSSTSRNSTSITRATRATTISTMPVNVVVAAAAIVPQAVPTDNDEEEDSYPTFMPSSQKHTTSSKNFASKAESKKWFDDDIFEYSAKDVNHRSLQIFDFDTSDNEIEEGCDALDVFFMDEDGASMARKRKSFQWDSVAEKRHCDEEVISPKSTSTPIPIPRPVKQPDQVVLDTLVPMRGFFQFR